MTLPQTAALVGEVLADRYRIDALLGAGAMGTVYRARHVKVGRPFAIKVLHRRLLADPKLLRRFDREAQIAGTLDHPNVVGVIDAGETRDGQRFLVMDLAEGETLGDLIFAGAPLPGPRVLRIAQQLCDGLEHAHERGLVHRDFKPDNVIITRDRDGREVPRIVDFGIALLGDPTQSDADRLTTKGVVLGTPHYMAPEHARGVVVDHRIDLFALGVICYEMLTGRMPFDGDGVDVARANLSTETPPMGIRVPDLDVDPLLEAFTRRLMMKSPNRRPQSAREARKLLDLIAHDRCAAAKALGVDPEMEVLLNRHTQRVETESSQPYSSQPHSSQPGQTAPARTSPITENVYVATTEKTRLPSRKRYVAGAAAFVVLGFAITLMVRPAHVTSSSANVALVSSDEPVGMKVTERGMKVTERGMKDAIVQVPTKLTFAKQVPQPVTMPAPHPIKPLATPIVDDPSGESVASLYTVVGRRLRKLDNGDPVVQALWIRYRRIRLNEVLVTPESRRATVGTLNELSSRLDVL